MALIVKESTCPYANCCIKLAHTQSSISQHLNDKHPSLFHSLELDKYKQYISICGDCSDYVQGKHHHCNECPAHYQSHFELVKHLKLSHVKWYYETTCERGIECLAWKNGNCSYNHFKYGLFSSTVPKINFIQDEDYLNDIHLKNFGFCRYDNPRNGSRCRRERCHYNHFKGRVKYVEKIIERNFEAMAEEWYIRQKQLEYDPLDDDPLLDRKYTTDMRR